MPRLLAPPDLGLILSYHCCCRCKHCVYACGPGWQDWMTVGDASEAVETIVSTWERAPRIHLTGGEPFDNSELLVEVARAVNRGGLDQFVETNAHWCRSVEQAHERFRVLQEAGVDSVLISCSPFQAETIPLRRVLWAGKAALDVFGSEGVGFYQARWVTEIARFSTDEPVPLQRWLDAYGRETVGRMFWGSYALLAGGRAGIRLGDLTHRFPASSFDDDDCRAELCYPHHSHFDLYGNHISSFCGGLSVGSWRELPQTIADFREQRYPELIGLLVEGGPFGLFELAQQSGYEEDPGGYAGKCHLCVSVRQHLATTGTYPELQPAQFYQML